LTAEIDFCIFPNDKETQSFIQTFHSPGIITKYGVESFLRSY